MPNTVVYSPTAEAALARIWLTSSAPDEVTRAADRIDQLLKFTPGSVGQDFGVYRELTVSPLMVTYSYLPDDCLVTITQVQLVS
jgi:hypothetical protein